MSGWQISLRGEKKRHRFEVFRYISIDNQLSSGVSELSNIPALSQVVVTEYLQKRIEAKGVELHVAVQAAPH